MEFGAVRASDAEREEAIERLRVAAAEGRLTFEELADRIEAASTAVVRADLDSLLTDLPAPSAMLVRRDEPMEISAVNDVKRNGVWIVPADSSYRSWIGNIQLDLRQARISDPEIRIRVWALFGTVDVLVPEGVEVDVQARSKFGQMKVEASAPTVPGAPRIVLTGGSVFGVLRVRHKRLWEKMLSRLEGR
jgi:hypothetical protein